MQSRIIPDGAVWVVIPKKAFAHALGLDLPWEAGQAAALETALVDNKVATISDREYATRFVIRKALRDV